MVGRTGPTGLDVYVAWDADRLRHLAVRPERWGRGSPGGGGRARGRRRRLWCLVGQPAGARALRAPRLDADRARRRAPGGRRTLGSWSTPDDADDVLEIADELYALPLAEFTPARDAKAKELKGTDLAAAVKALQEAVAGGLGRQPARTPRAPRRSSRCCGRGARCARRRRAWTATSCAR